MDYLNKSPDDADDDCSSQADPSDDLTRVIRSLIARQDALHLASDPNEILEEIKTAHPHALLRRGSALALKACRRLITQQLRRMSALDPSEEDGPQFDLPGLEKVPTHIMYSVPIPNSNQTKVVARHTRDATLEQHKSCLRLKQINTQRCIAREADHQRIIDLLVGTGCDSLREWEQRFGKRAA